MSASIPSSDKPSVPSSAPEPSGSAKKPVVSADPIIHANPIIHTGSAGGNSPIIGGGPVAGSEEEFQEYMSAGCTAVVPPGARKIYLIMVTVTMLVGGAIVFGLFKLLDL